MKTGIAVVALLALAWAATAFAGEQGKIDEIDAVVLSSPNLDVSMDAPIFLGSVDGKCKYIGKVHTTLRDPKDLEERVAVNSAHTNKIAEWTGSIAQAVCIQGDNLVRKSVNMGFYLGFGPQGDHPILFAADQLKLYQVTTPEQAAMEAAKVGTTENRFPIRLIDAVAVPYKAGFLHGRLGGVKLSWHSTTPNTSFCIALGTIGGPFLSDAAGWNQDLSPCLTTDKGGNASLVVEMQDFQYQKHINGELFATIVPPNSNGLFHTDAIPTHPLLAAAFRSSKTSQ